MIKICLMKMRHLITFGFLLILVSSDCRVISRLDDLLVGSTSLVLQDQSFSSKSSFMLAFDSKFKETPTAALSLKSFLINTVGINTWSLELSMMTASSAVIVFEYERDRWLQMHISYWFTTRQDLILSQHRLQLTRIAGFKKITSIALSRPISSPSKYILKPFINGYRGTSISSISLSIYTENLTSNSVDVVVESEMALSSIYISYVAFDYKGGAGFSSYGSGIVELQFSSLKLYSLHKHIYNSPYFFYGFSQLQINQNSPFNFNSQMDSEYYLQLSVNRACNFTLFYLVIGVQPCCVDGLMYGDECVGECPTNTYPHVYRDGGISCRTCPMKYNFIVNGKKDGCTCRNEFILQNGICKLSMNESRRNVSTITVTTNINANMNTMNIIRSNTIASDNSFVPLSQSSPQEQETSQQLSSTTTKSQQQQQPSSPSPTPSLASTFNLPQSVFPQFPEGDCSFLLNSYWTGYRCVCLVGYTFINGLCTPSSSNASPRRPSQFTHQLSIISQQVECKGTNQLQLNGICVCMQGFIRSGLGTCERVNCPNDSRYVGGQCICNDGYRRQGNQCRRQCPFNTINNGVGECICVNGFHLNELGECVTGQPCPPFSTRNNTQCVCDTDYTNYDGVCAKCAEGQLFIDNECIVICGMNEVADGGECRCRQGYGVDDEGCSLCNANSFIANGYCVECPLNSVLIGIGCVCEEGFIRNGFGSCESACTKQFEIFDGGCRCRDGYGYSESGECVVCDVVDGRCGCAFDEVPLNQGCVCRDGLGRFSNGRCTNCSELENGFMVDGNCAVCPPPSVYDGFQCICPQPLTQVNGICTNECEQGQLLDVDGVCYWCPYNEVGRDGRCQCVENYQRINGRCELVCGQGQFLINSVCGRCATNTIYDPIAQECLCPFGFFKNSNGFCQESRLSPINCGEGFFNDEGCLRCSENCLRCMDADRCTECIEFYEVRGGVCVVSCGDGFILSQLQECDDGNTIMNDGCSGCRVDDGWICQGVPSVCTLIIGCGDGVLNGIQQCDDGNNNDRDGCSGCRVQTGWRCTGSPSVCVLFSGMRAVEVIPNVSNLFVLLELDHIFTFSSQSEMRNFIRYQFPDKQTQPASSYCLQMSSLRLFQCLFIYPSGLPNYLYFINFSYSREGKEGFLQIGVDALDSPIVSRSLV